MIHAFRIGSMNAFAAAPHAAERSWSSRVVDVDVLRYPELGLLDEPLEVGGVLRDRDEQLAVLQGQLGMSERRVPQHPLVDVVRGRHGLVRDEVIDLGSQAS